MQKTYSDVVFRVLFKVEPPGEILGEWAFQKRSKLERIKKQDQYSLMKVSYLPPYNFCKKDTNDAIIYIIKVTSGNEVFMKKASKILCVVLALLTVAAASSASASISDAITGSGVFRKAK